MANDAELRIKIGLSLDADASRVFEPIERSADRSSKRVRDALDRASKTRRTGSDDPYRENARNAEKAAQEEMRIADRKFKFMKKIHADLLREQQRAAREAEQISRRNQRIADASAVRMSGGSVRDMGRAASYAASVGKDMLRGAGVKADLSSIVTQNVELESRASKLSNSSWKYDGGKGTPVSKSEILGDVSKIASMTGSDMGDILGGLEEFVSKTGDLQTARDALMEMAKISKATGASLTDMMSSSGDIAIQLGDAAGKGEILAQVSKIMAGQGQVGAVEYKDLANGIATIAAKQGKFKLNDSTKSLFSGAGVTNDVAANVGVLGVLTQAVRQSGGKATARQSLNSAQAFIRDLTGGSGLKRMGEFQIDPFADKEKTTLKDPKELILEMLKKTGGDQAKLARLLPNQNSRAVVDSFSNDYNRGVSEAKAEAAKKKKTLSKGEMQAAGAAAVSKRFDELAKAAMSDEEVSAKFAAAMDTTESKVNQFNVELSKATSQTQSALLPALMKLAPIAVDMANAASKFTSWATQNPLMAAFTVAGASILKNVTGEIVRAAIERAIVGGIAKGIAPPGAANTLLGSTGANGLPTNRPGGMGGLKADAAAMGVLGTATTALAIASMSVAAFQAGKVVIDEMIQNKANADTKAANDAAAYLNVNNISEAERKIRESGVASPEQEAELEAARQEEKAKYDEIKARVTKARINQQVDGGQTGFVAQMAESGWRSMMDLFGKDTNARTWDQVNADNADIGALNNLEAAMDRIGGHLTKELTVKVTNMPRGGLPPSPGQVR